IDEAQRAYEQTLQIDPEAAVAANDLAWIYAQRGEQLDKALQLAQTAKRKLPNEASINDTLGWVYYQKNLFGPAVQALEDAVHSKPNVPEMQYRLGMAYFRNGDLQKARQALQQALKLKGNFQGADEARTMLSGLTP